jgi:hypothetical protein
VLVAAPPLPTDYAATDGAPADGARIDVLTCQRVQQVLPGLCRPVLHGQVVGHTFLGGNQTTCLFQSFPLCRVAVQAILPRLAEAAGKYVLKISAHEFLALYGQRLSLLGADLRLTAI